MGFFVVKRQYWDMSGNGPAFWNIVEDDPDFIKADESVISAYVAAKNNLEVLKELQKKALRVEELIAKRSKLEERIKAAEDIGTSTAAALGIDIRTFRNELTTINSDIAEAEHQHNLIETKPFERTGRYTVPVGTMYSYEEIYFNNLVQSDEKSFEKIPVEDE